MVHDTRARDRSEEELRQSEATFRSLAEESLAGVSIIQDERFRYVNPALAGITGYSRDEMLVASSMLDLQVPEEDRPLVRENLRRRQNGEVPHVRFNTHIQRKDGSLLTVEIFGSRILFEGHPAVLSTVMDITARVQAEDARLASERRYASLVHSLEGIVWEADARTFQFTFVSNFAETLLGYPVSRWLEPTFWRDHIHPEDRESAVNYCVERTTHGQSHDFEYRMIARDGRAVWLRDVVTVEMADGKPLTLRGVMVDISKAKQAEADLREAQDRLQFAVTAGKVGLWNMDLRTGGIEFSPEWKRQIGYDDDEMPSVQGSWESRVHPEDLERARGVLHECLHGAKRAWEAEYRMRHKDGSYRHILSRASIVAGDDGTPIRVVGAHVDITEWTLLQAQFRQAQRIESVGQLAGGIAHDFNNLLTVINGMSDLALAQISKDDPVYADVHEIRQAGERAATLTRQLLAFSRRQILRPEMLNLNAVVADMEAMLRRLIGEDISLVVVPAQGLGGVRADRGQMEQVIVNLVVNARDAMPAGGTLTIESANVDLGVAYAAAHQGMTSGPSVMLAIYDTGIGMDERTQARVFEPFFTTKEHGKGTGLGLSTVYGIVKQSNGSIWVESTPGRGTTFRIYLPRVEGIAESVAAETSSVRPPTGAETILLVEDADNVRALARKMLEPHGYMVLDAPNGAEALRMCEEHAGFIHLLLTDIVMPGISGIVLAEQLTRRRPGIKVLYTSGYTDDAIARHGIESAGVAFLQKPYVAASLVRKVREVLDTAT